MENTEQAVAVEAVSEDQVRKCPSCGAALVFDPVHGTLKCMFCDYVCESSEVRTAGEENDLAALLAGVELDERDETLEVRCPTCGGTGHLPVNTVSGFCPYCRNPIVASSRSLRTLRPQGIVPFAITRGQGEAMFRQWVSALWFAPNELKHANLHESLKGIYRPIWTFDFLAKCDYTGERGVYYYVTRTRRVNGKTETYQERRTRWTPTWGRVKVSFDDIVVFASNRLSPQLQRDVGPWAIKLPQAYTEDTVRGFVEESYDMPLVKGLNLAKEQTVDEVRSAVRRDIGGDEQRILTMNTRYSNLTYKLLLVPFWSSVYHFKGKDYQFLVNGENGKASGERPYSGWKIAFFVMSIIVVLMILLAIFSQN